VRVLFASGDVGGARAIIPVMEKCLEKGIRAAFLNKGYISKEAPCNWERIAIDEIGSEALLKKFLHKNDTKVFVFGSSQKDCTALTLARLMKKYNMPVIHVLDHWSSYRSRLETDGLPALRPNCYTVMDRIAYESAIEDGIDKDILRITGHPAIADLEAEFVRWQARNVGSILGSYGFDPGKKLISFVSEPAEKDQGGSPDSPNYRGYTEKVVLQHFCKALQSFSDEIQIAILPHPKEDVDALSGLWEKYRGSLYGKTLNLPRGRYGLFMSDAVAGMASSLMYEAWLLGKPVISIQPGLRLQTLRMLQKRPDVFFLDSYAAIPQQIKEWATCIVHGTSYATKPDLAIHEKAPEMIYDLIKSYIALH
jgi:hypothetical protein